MIRWSRAGRLRAGRRTLLLIRERHGESAVPATGAALWEPAMAQPPRGFLQLHPLLVEMPNEALAIGGECVFAGDHIGAVASDPPPVHAKGGIWGCETMARNNPGSLPGNIHSEIPSCFDTNSLMVDQSKGKKRAWPPTVALASGQFQQKLGECLYAGQCGWQLGQPVQLPVL